MESSPSGCADSVFQPGKRFLRPSGTVSFRQLKRMESNEENSFVREREIGDRVEAYLRAKNMDKVVTVQDHTAQQSGVKSSNSQTQHGIEQHSRT